MTPPCRRTALTPDGYAVQPSGKALLRGDVSLLIVETRHARCTPMRWRTSRIRGRPDGTSADYDAQAASKSRQGLVCVVVRPYEVPVSVANARRACRSKSAEKLAHFCCYIADSLEKTRDSLVFYRASSYLIFIWFPLDSPPSGLVLSVQGRRLRYLALTLAPSSDFDCSPTAHCQRRMGSL